MNEKLKLSLKVSGIVLAVAQAFSPGAMAQTADPVAGAGQRTSLMIPQPAQPAEGLLSARL